ALMEIAGYADRLLLGDCSTYAVADGCEREWADALSVLEWTRGPKPYTFVHMEALRVGFGHALPFYEAVRDYPERKVYVAPERLRPIAERLGCELVPCPLETSHEHARRLADAVAQESPRLVVVSAGRGGKLLQGKLAGMYGWLGCAQVDV